MKNNIGLFFTGIGIGIFLGLSESPILLQILIPVLTIIVGLLSILTGQKNDEKQNTNEGSLLAKKNISPFPIMWMILGMVGGSFLGLLAKNYDITGRGKIFGRETKSERNVDSLDSRVAYLKLQTQIMVLEKNIEYISSIDAKNLKQENLVALNQIIESLNNSKDTKDINRSQSVLKDNTSAENREMGNVCKELDLCKKKGVELVNALSKSTDRDIKRILNDFKNSPDSLKLMINKKCECE